MPSQPNTYSYIAGKIIRETEAAVLFKVSGGKSEWFPRSQITEIYRDIEDGTEGDQIKVADWILSKKGISV